MDGRLRPVWDTYNRGDPELIHALFSGQGGHLPARVRAFIDFLAAEILLQ
jgi:DNA-binding transcriptional LysR family regulator